MTAIIQATVPVGVNMLDTCVLHEKFFLTRPNCSANFQRIGGNSSKTSKPIWAGYVNHSVHDERKLSPSPVEVSKKDLKEACLDVSQTFIALLASRPSPKISFHEFYNYVTTRRNVELKAMNLVTIAWNLLIEQLGQPENLRVPQERVCIQKTKTQSLCLEAWEDSFKASLKVLAEVIITDGKTTKECSLQKAKNLIPGGQILHEVWLPCWRALLQKYKHIGRPPRAAAS